MYIHIYLYEGIWLAVEKSDAAPRPGLRSGKWVRLSLRHMRDLVRVVFGI